MRSASMSCLERSRTQSPSFDLLDITQKANFQLANFMLGAWRTRQGVLRTRLGFEPETPEYVAKLQVLMPQEEPRSEPSTGPLTDETDPVLLKDEMVTDSAAEQLLNLDLDSNAIDWDAWGNLVAGAPVMSAFGGFGMGPTTEW